MSCCRGCRGWVSAPFATRLVLFIIVIIESLWLPAQQITRHYWINQSYNPALNIPVFQRVPWWLSVVYHVVIWCSMMVVCGVPWYYMVFHDGCLWCSMMLYGVPWWLSMVFHDVIWCSMMVVCGVPWCYMVFHDGCPWCSMMLHGVPWWLSVVFHGILWSSKMVYWDP